MGGTPGPKGTFTPGRGSVRDKLSINREDALADEYESAQMARQEQVNNWPLEKILNFTLFVRTNLNRFSIF